MRNSRKALFVLLALLVVVAVVKTVNPSDSKHTITGSITLTDSTSENRDICNPTGGYSDLSDNAQATVTDETGKILGMASVDTGSGSSEYVPGEYYGYGIRGDASYSGSCTHTFTIKNVAKAKFYTVTVGHRKAPVHSFDELESNGWTVALSIGD